MERRPDWILLSVVAVAGRHSNSSTARDSTRNGNTIEVSLSLGHPPLHPSILFVHSSDMNLSVPPNIVCAVDNLLLLSVNLRSGRSSLSPNTREDYFVYRAHPSCPSLQLLRRPHPYFNKRDVGLLPRSDGQYTVAVLIPTVNLNQYRFHLFHSDKEHWSSSMLSVEEPQIEFPVNIPRGRHLTSAVITIGGEGGTMGWVDLWYGMLLCDVLDPKPSLRALPLPLPPLKEQELSYNDGNGPPFGIGAGWQRRGITFVRDNGCLKLVHLEISEVRRPGYDNETRAPSFRVDDWVLTTWSNTRMTNSYEDWHQDYVVQASDIRIDNPAISQVLQSGLLVQRTPQDEQLALRNLSMAHPVPCVSGEDVVHVVARKKYMHPKAWILAVDMVNGKLQAVEEFGAQRHPSFIMYFPSIISKYMSQATTPGN
ncbi:hypothetical protein E2562_036583 [Oryza meyeriana var. granulata]|uniref:DUF1618 domain-containing protein n=1 Tax=Oryza meyeriana var. granulata TaxID=110450 RepID=A0A6G1ET81_9ORYZ|nr:hypothetical protein E2562_036583 [Oryza meyeriana var. granulata]